MDTLHDTQKAWIVERRGTPQTALKLRDDWKVPKELQPGQVLVKVQAAALNPVGWKLMRLSPNAGSGRPLPAEYDLSGVIVNGNDTKFKAGDEVFGYVETSLAMSTRQGALAQYVRMPAEYLVSRPSNISPVEAAGITLTAQTAYEGLFDAGGLEAGQTVLINGGSSAVGSYAIQLAKAKGAKVVATASGKNEKFVRDLGADEFIDYTKEPLHEYLKRNPPSPKYHLIYDAVALIDPSLYVNSPAYLAPQGTYISTGPMPKDLSAGQLWLLVKTSWYCFMLPSWLGGVKRKYKIHILKHNANRLEEIRQMVASGAVKPLVDSVYEFEDVLKAYERILSGRATGKVVVKVDSTVV